MSEIGQTALHKFKVVLTQAIADEELLHDPEIEFIEMAHYCMMCLRGWIWAEHVEEWEVKFPKDWWQAFKERWFPAWALKRWPVVYQYHRAELDALYPTLRLPNYEPQYTWYFHPAEWQSLEPPSPSGSGQ